MYTECVRFYTKPLYVLSLPSMTSSSKPDLKVRNIHVLYIW